MDGNLTPNRRTGDFWGFTSFMLIAASVGTAVVSLFLLCFIQALRLFLSVLVSCTCRSFSYTPLCYSHSSFDLVPTHCLTIHLSHSTFPTTINSYMSIGTSNWLHMESGNNLQAKIKLSAAWRNECVRGELCPGQEGDSVRRMLPAHEEMHRELKCHTQFTWEYLYPRWLLEILCPGFVFQTLSALTDTPFQLCTSGFIITPLSGLPTPTL